MDARYIYYVQARPEKNNCRTINCQSEPNNKGVYVVRMIAGKHFPEYGEEYRERWILVFSDGTEEYRSYQTTTPPVEKKLNNKLIWISHQDSSLEDLKLYF
jgi:hypothetical protein